MSTSVRGGLRTGHPAGGYAATAATWIGGLILFAPVFWMVLTSFKSEQDAVADPPTLFFVPTLSHYAEVFSSGVFASAWNSVLASVMSTLFVIIFAVPAAYALSVRPVPKAKDALFFFISTKMMPVAAGIVPLYLIAKDLDLLNTRLILIILYTGMNLPLAIWMIRSFMSEVPGELLEAARLDGASPAREMATIILPLIAPGLASTALLCFIFAWNEYFLAVNFTTTVATLPIFMQKFLSFGKLYTAQIAAVATLVNLPVVLAGWFVQKSLVRGLTFGAVK
ncbi:MAG TPA: carbohydrate ABC transporter permease [Rhodopila sp.]|nr:carbohydrate ABC transporter permease [Rhodopila sp.]